MCMKQRYIFFATVILWREEAEVKLIRVRKMQDVPHSNQLNLGLVLNSDHYIRVLLVVFRFVGYVCRCRTGLGGYLLNGRQLSLFIDTCYTNVASCLGIVLPETQSCDCDGSLYPSNRIELSYFVALQKKQIRGYLPRRVRRNLDSKHVDNAKKTLIRNFIWHDAECLINQTYKILQDTYRHGI